MNDEYDPEPVIERLLLEVRGVNRVLTDAKRALYYDDRVQGLSLAGGIATLRRQRDEAEEAVKALEKELYRLTHSS